MNKYFVVMMVLVLSACSKHPETDAQKLTRWRHEYESALAQVVTNEIVGLKSYRMDLYDGEPEPTNWTALVTADYVNHVGGIDRTNFFVHASTNFPALILNQSGDGLVHWGALFQTEKEATGF